ncbi:hypothetical protein RCL1_007867 [Eukaryota sp. TZLM3-RCL]
MQSPKVNSPSQQVLLQRLTSEALTLRDSNPEKALVLLAKALVINDHYLPALLNRSAIFLKLGMYDSALSDAQLAFRHNSNSPNAIISCSKALLALKDFAQSRYFLSLLTAFTLPSQLLDEVAMIQNSLPPLQEDHEELEGWSSTVTIQEEKATYNIPTTPNLNSSVKIIPPKIPPPPQINKVAFDTSSASKYYCRQQKAVPCDVSKINTRNVNDYRKALNSKIATQLSCTDSKLKGVLNWENKVLKR